MFRIELPKKYFSCCSRKVCVTVGCVAGIILERLNSKIVDVERLDRESESDDCYNWTIKATIRGEVLRELGVIYNGNYYAICEHPGYKEDEQRDEEIEEEEEEEEDRL
jgi:hypothetical protein